MGKEPYPKKSIFLLSLLSVLTYLVTCVPMDQDLQRDRIEQRRDSDFSCDTDEDCYPFKRFCHTSTRKCYVFEVESLDYERGVEDDVVSMIVPIFFL